MVQQYLDHAREILTSPYSNTKMGSNGSRLVSLFGHQSSYDLRKGFPLLTTKQMATPSIIHELLWFLRGDTNIEYLEKNKVRIWRSDTFQFHLPAMQREGIFPNGIVKYTPEWDGALKKYGKMVGEDHEFAQRWGDAGPIYGKQWRKWRHYDEEKKEFVELDQLGRVLDNMRKHPIGKKHIVSAWNPVDVPDMSLPPCHVMFQMTANEEGELDLHMYQRSCDQFLGVPFNLASYAMLTQIIAQELGLTPRRFVHTFGDSHFYTGLAKRGAWYEQNFGELQDRVRNVGKKSDYSLVLDWINNNSPRDANEEQYDHVTGVLEQLSREPKPLPKLTIARKPFDKLTIDDFVLEGYEHHPKIDRSMAV